MPVDDRADVRPGPVDAGVEDGLEVQDARPVSSSETTSSGSTSSSATPLRLIQISALRAAGADVAERQVGVALGGEDAAGPRDLLAQALGDGDH